MFMKMLGKCNDNIKEWLRILYDRPLMLTILIIKQSTKNVAELELSQISINQNLFID